jgi:hypothetical protein
MPDKVKYMTWFPAGPRSTVTGMGWLFPPSTIALPEFRDRLATEKADLNPVWDEDMVVMSTLQRGYQSRFAPRGPYAPSEATFAQFNRWLVAQYRATEKATA